MSRLTPSLLSDRWRILPPADLEPVTIYPRLASGYGAGIAVGQARRHPSSKAVTAGSRVVLTEEKVQWGLWTATFASAYEPKPGDRITDQNGVNYLALPDEAVTKQDMGQQYCVQTRREL